MLVTIYEFIYMYIYLYSHFNNRQINIQYFCSLSLYMISEIGLELGFQGLDYIRPKEGLNNPFSASEEFDHRSPVSSECGQHGGVHGRSRDGGLCGVLRLHASGFMEEGIPVRFVFPYEDRSHRGARPAGSVHETRRENRDGADHATATESRLSSVIWGVSAKAILDQGVHWSSVVICGRREVFW